MKRFITVAVLSLFVSIPSYAQLGFSLGPQAGVSFSSFQKGVSDFYGTGFGGGVHGDLRIVKFLTTRLAVDYVRFSSDKDKLAEALVTQFGGQASDYMVDGLNIGVFSIFASGIGRIPTGSPVTPYGLIGLGVNFVSTSELMASTSQATFSAPSSSETKFGLNFGGGAELAVPFGSVFLEVKYVMVFTDPENSSHIPVFLGATFGL